MRDHTEHNTDVNDPRCAGGFVRVRGWCSGAVGLQSLQGCEEKRCDKGKRCDGGLLDTNECVDRIMEK